MSSPSCNLLKVLLMVKFRRVESVDSDADASKIIPNTIDRSGLPERDDFAVSSRAINPQQNVQNEGMEYMIPDDLVKQAWKRGSSEGLSPPIHSADGLSALPAKTTTTPGTRSNAPQLSLSLGINESENFLNFWARQEELAKSCQLQLAIPSSSTSSTAAAQSQSHPQSAISPLDAEAVEKRVKAALKGDTKTTPHEPAIVTPSPDALPAPSSIKPRSSATAWKPPRPPPSDITSPVTVKNRATTLSRKSTMIVPSPASLVNRGIGAVGAGVAGDAKDVNVKLLRRANVKKRMPIPARFRVVNV